MSVTELAKKTRIEGGQLGEGRRGEEEEEAKRYHEAGWHCR
jgi:hypothetical protein